MYTVVPTSFKGTGQYEAEKPADKSPPERGIAPWLQHTVVTYQYKRTGEYEVQIKGRKEE